MAIGKIGLDYLVSNGPIDASIEITLDNVLQAATNAATDPLVANALETFKRAVDQNYLGNLVVLIDTSFNGPYDPPCFARGTMILTPSGEVAVETLRAGDRVSLAGGGIAEVSWVGHRRLRLDAVPDRDRLAPIRVSRSALGGGLPRRDLVLSPDHALGVDGVLVPAGLLVDGERIRREPVDAVAYHHLELPAHALLIAEGAPAESYRNTGNRRHSAAPTWSRCVRRRSTRRRPTPIRFAPSWCSAARVSTPCARRWPRATGRKCCLSPPEPTVGPAAPHNQPLVERLGFSTG